MKVLVGLSGGVDSAIAAYLLKEQGYDVTCAFMRNWDSFANNDFLGNPTIQDDICPQEQDYLDAKNVADQLGLPLLRVDFVKEYWEYVFTAFLEEYERGRTPNPDILCNKYIKFDSFLRFSQANGFDMLATGHYAQVKHFEDHSLLLRAVDQNKDQTYFLCQIADDALHKTLFPIGHLEKKTVRSLARSLGLNIAEKKDSTGICFIGERHFKEFLQNYLPAKPGKIINIETHEHLGDHEGVLYYTIGQRKGLGIGGSYGPWFVCGKNVTTNELYVCNQNADEWLYSDSCLVSQIHWFNHIPQTDLHISAKFRYRQKDHPVVVHCLDERSALVMFENTVSSVTCGQEAVFYDGEVCLGGGVIDEVYKDGRSLNDKIEEAIYGK